MGDFHFIRPEWLLLLIPAIIGGYGLWRQQDRSAEWRDVFDEHLLRHLVVGDSNTSRIRPIHCLLATWLLATIALAGPSWRQEASPFADDQAGLFVLLEVSESMLESDIQPSRLERAKHKLSDLLAERGGSATGLIVYSGSAHLVMPLTRDDRIISAMIEDLTPDLMPEDGDALAQALQLADSMFAESQAAGSVLVITDSVATHQALALETNEIRLPTQFLLVRPANDVIDSGLDDAATYLSAPVVRLTVDAEDVGEIASRAETRIRSVAATDESSRWVDDGYNLLPLLALLLLMWSRKGWLLR